MKDLLLGLLMIIGAGVLTYGLHSAWPPLGWSVLGAMIIFVSWRLI